MIKNECKIVRDLFPNYIEKQVSYETKEFVDNHLKNCKECSELLDGINKKEEDNTEEEKEIDFLKKYNEKITIAKTIIIFLLIIIVSSVGIFSFRYIAKYINGKKAYEIISEVYDKTEKFKKHNNLRLSITGNNYDVKYSYKDGYLKEERIFTEFDSPVKCITYGRIGDFSDVIPLNDARYVGIGLRFDMDNNYIGSNGSQVGKHDVNEFYLIDKLKNKDILECSNIRVSENDEYYFLEEFDGRVCEITYYISKKSMLLDKYEEFEYQGSGGIGEITHYTYSVNTVKDEDVILKDIEKYDILSNFNKPIWECYTRE